MNTMRGDTLFVRLPIALEIPVKDHVHALENEALWLVPERQDALGPEDVRPFLLYQVVDPGHEFFRIHIAVMREGNRLHLLVMIVLQPTMMMVVMMVVMRAARPHS